MKCLKCKHSWKRTKWQEFISFLSKCPKCGTRWILRYWNMCGRFNFSNQSDLKNTIPEKVSSSFNFAPSQKILAIDSSDNVVALDWGYKPKWLYHCWSARSLLRLQQLWAAARVRHLLLQIQEAHPWKGAGWECDAHVKRFFARALARLIAFSVSDLSRKTEWTHVVACGSLHF